MVHQLQLASHQRWQYWEARMLHADNLGGLGVGEENVQDRLWLHLEVNHWGERKGRFPRPPPLFVTQELRFPRHGQAASSKFPCEKGRAEGEGAMTRDFGLQARLCPR